MASISYEPEQGDTRRTAATAANWLGAAASLALIGGLAAWGYQLTVRDVSGIPVVLASGGPMRVAPEDPGGALASNQGLTVNTVAAADTARPADRLVLAPDPIGLADEDLSTPPVFEDTPVVDAALSVDEPLAPPSDDPLQALADSIAAGAAPLGEVAPAPNAPLPDVDLAAVKATPVAWKNGLARSLRPAPRPQGLRVSAAATTAPRSSLDVDPATIAPGTRLVQLGAFGSPEIAKAQWARAEDLFGDFLRGKQRVIQRTESGSSVFYRLRVKGFENGDDTRIFCAALSPRMDCIEVVQR